MKSVYLEEEWYEEELKQHKVLLYVKQASYLHTEALQTLIQSWCLWVKPLPR